MGKKTSGEVYPLLSTDWLGTPTYRQQPVSRYVRQSDEEEDIPAIEDDDEVFDIIDQKKKKSVNLVWLDVILMVIDFLQILALIQSMALRWVYPKTWLKATAFIFGFNIDAWEIQKFVNGSIYKSVQDYYMPSSSVGISYEHICYGWFGTVAGLALIYILLHIYMKFWLYPEKWARSFMSRIQFMYMILIHVLTLPFGIVLFRIFECEPDFNKVYTMNEYQCFSAGHWKVAAPAIIYMLFVFIVWPTFLVWKIRQEGMTGTSDGYLAFIMIKETEYKIHLNRSWLNDALWIFSSYKYRGCYYKPFLQVVKLTFLIIFVSAFAHIKIQALLSAILLLIMVVFALVVRPYRLTSCNIFLLICIFTNLANCFLGALLANYNVYTLPSAWLTPEYVIWFLVIIQVFWLISLVLLLVYLISRTLCHSTKSCYKRPVWPNIATSGNGQLTAETRKFMIAIIKAKIVHEKILRVPAIFAPVHDLSRHIQIINTYCREAEYMQDALHLVLWEVLDGMVEAHASLSTKSIFAECCKKSIRRTAAQFMTMVPMFSQRLAQRDYDFMLVPPHKKRLLLKMYIIGLFLNGRSDRLAKKKLLDPAMGKMWPALAADKEYEEEDGYYEDLYPVPTNQYSDDLLNVVVQDSSDAESTEDEDNVQGMLKILPEVSLIDLEIPMFEEEQADSDDSTRVPHSNGVTFQAITSSKSHPARPLSALSKSSAIGQNTGHTSSSLFNSQVSLRQDTHFDSSDMQTLPVPNEGQTPFRDRSPSPKAPPTSPSTSDDRLVSARKEHRARGLSPTGSSVVSSQPSRPGSAGSIIDENQLSAINPGYIPDIIEKNKEKLFHGDNPAYVEDEFDDAESAITFVTSATTGSNSRKRKQKKKRTSKA